MNTEHEGFSGSLTPTTALSSREVWWAAFVTMVVICPWAMVAMWAFLVTFWFGGAYFATGLPIVRNIPSPVWATLLIWYVQSLGVSVWTKCRKTSSLVGLVVGWILLTASMIDPAPAVLGKLLSSNDTAELLRAALSTSVIASGWLLTGIVILRRTVAKS